MKELAKESRITAIGVETHITHITSLNRCWLSHHTHIMPNPLPIILVMYRKQ